nr:MAG TPA: Protein of unknown function (DUF669) [Caudoviricetes sp.]
MIQKPNNWENVRAFSDFQKLPLGAYVCTIKQAVVRQTDYGDQLCIVFDISTGEWAGYYQDDFDNNPRDDKKWKGVLRQFLPKNDGSDKDEWAKSLLKGLTTAVEESNRGYTWNWEEKSLAGKEIGILMRNEEWEYNGKHGWAVRPFRAISVDSIADATFKLPKDKPLKGRETAPSPYGQAPAPDYGGYNVAPVPDFVMLEDDDAQLPF